MYFERKAYLKELISAEGNDKDYHRHSPLW